MSNCIICGNPIVEKSIEHIIPQALGNKKFVIDRVCKKCNSLLGDKIDCGCTNNILAKLFRQQNNIKGNSNRVPNAFECGKGENGEDIRLSMDMKPSIVPRAKQEGESFHVVASSAEEAIEMIEKKLKRLGRPPLTEEQKEKIRQKKPERYQPTISFETSLDLQKINLEWIKIAFETLFYQHGEEILQEQSIAQLRKILYDYLYLTQYDSDIIAGKVGVPADTTSVPTEELKKVLNDNVIHIIQVSSVGNELRVLMLIEGMLTGAVNIQVEDSSKYCTKTYIVCYPSGNIIEE